MAVCVWFHSYDAENLATYEPDVKVERYAGQGRDEIVTTEIQRSGLFSHIKKSFVLGKVLFWEKEGSAYRMPFVRVDNHPAYRHGMVLCPENWINIRFHRHSRTINQLTNLKRVQLLAAPYDDFIRRVFTTYDEDILVCKPTDFERHFMVYCDAIHLFEGRVSERP